MANHMIPVLNSHALDFEQAFDLANPRALINIVPTYFQNAMKSMPAELLEMGIEDLEKMKPIQEVVDKLDMLRTSFWLEYNRSQKTRTPMSMYSVFSGICYPADFKKYYVSNSYKLLYIITPPKDYTMIQHIILQKAMDQELRILRMPTIKPIFNKEGEQVGEEVDSKLLQVQQKIAESMRNRLMGMPVVRSMQINQNFNHNQAADSAGPNLSELTQDDLQKLVDTLKKKHGVLDSSTSEPIDVKALEKASGDKL